MLVDQVVQAGHFASQAILKLTPADFQYLCRYQVKGELGSVAGTVMEKLNGSLLES